MSEANATLNIGLDPGFGAVKVTVVGPEGLQVATIPSVVGVGETELGLLGLGDLGRRRARRATRQPDQVTFEGVTRLRRGRRGGRPLRPAGGTDGLFAAQ